MKESGSSSRSCESRRRRGRPQTTRGVRKRCRIRAGWRHEWIPRAELPSRNVLAIRQVVRGPFSSPRLISASPYVLVSSNCKNEEREACKSVERCPRIKRGIPDPWAEYLAYRGFCSKDDQRTVRRYIDLGCKNIYVTATVWKDLGLPLGQGIPDPWKIPASGKKWVSHKGAYGHGDKLQPREKHCGVCKPSEATLPIASSGAHRRFNKAAVNTSPDLSNPSPHQETRCEEVSKQETLQWSANFTGKAPSSSPEYRSGKETRECAAPCNQGLTDIILKRRPSAEAEQQTPEVQRVAKAYQPRVSGSKSPRGRKAVQKSTDIGAPTSGTRHSVQEKLLPLDCATQTLTHGSSRKLKVQDAACMCEGSDFRKNRVGFETSNVPRTDRGRHSLNQNLNVTQLPCGCVHVSPCNGMQGYLGSGIEGPGIGPRGGVAFPGDGSHGGSLDQRNWGYPQPEDKPSQDQKPKMMSRMKRMITNWKSTSKSKHRTGKAQIVKSEDRVSQIPNDSKLVCCQCSCPYLKIENPPVGTSSKSVEKKKKKCVCNRCIAKRERREKHRSKKAAFENQKALVSPKPCRRCLQVESPDQLVEEIPADAEVPKYDAPVTKKKTDYPPTAPPEESIIIHENKGDLKSSDAWKSPAVFGAPWYSSDSGENADVSEVSRHTPQYGAMLQASPETSLVTSYTFISRIDHSSVLECLKKRGRPKKGERMRQEFDADCLLRGNCLPRPDPGETRSRYKTDSNIIENEIPLLNIEESEAKGSQASPRQTCIGPLTGFTSFSKDEETSQSSVPTCWDKKRRNSFGKRANPRRKETVEKFIGPKVEHDSIKSQKLIEDSQQIHLATPKTETILETGSSTDDDSEELKASNLRNKIQETGHSAYHEDLSLSSKGTQSPCDPMITTIVSPRRFSINSSTSCSPDSCSQKCRRDRAPANSMNGTFSEDPRSTIGKQNVIVYRCEIPSTPGPYVTKTSARSNETKNSRDSTPRYGIRYPAEVDAFLDEGRSDFNRVEETENENPREVRILVPNETYQGENKGPADNKCYLKYCSLRRSGSCVISSNRRILKIQHPSYVEHGNRENGLQGVTEEKQFPLGRRAFSTSSNQRNSALLGNAFSCVSPARPELRLQNKLDIG